MLSGLVCWGHQHLPPVLRPRSDSSRLHPGLRGSSSAESHRGGVRTQGTGTQVRRPNSKEETASAEVLWMWAPRLMVALAVLVIALEVVPRASALTSEVAAWRVDASRVASVETLTEDRVRLRMESTRLQRQLSEQSAEPTTSGDMLGQLDALAAEAAVRLTRVEPGLPLTEGAQERVPLAVDVAGRFHEIGDYLARLEASAFQVRRFALTSPTDPFIQQGTTVLEATLSLEVVRSSAARGRDE